MHATVGLDGMSLDSETMMAPSILLADDDDLLRHVLARALEQGGHDVIEVWSGAEALEVFRRGAAVDLIISDVSIPTSTDPAVLAELRGYAASIPVIFVSGYARDEASRLFPVRQDVPFLPKPFAVDELLAAVRKLLPPPSGSRIA